LNKGTCKNTDCNKIHLTKRGLIPYGIQITKNNTDENKYDLDYSRNNLEFINKSQIVKYHDRKNVDTDISSRLGIFKNINTSRYGDGEASKDVYNGGDIDLKSKYIKSKYLIPIKIDDAYFGEKHKDGNKYEYIPEHKAEYIPEHKAEHKAEYNFIGNVEESNTKSKKHNISMEDSDSDSDIGFNMDVNMTVDVNTNISTNISADISADINKDANMNVITKPRENVSDYMLNKKYYVERALEDQEQNKIRRMYDDGVIDIVSMFKKSDDTSSDNLFDDLLYSYENEEYDENTRSESDDIMNSILLYTDDSKTKISLFDMSLIKICKK
jgi:hypothetical protein